MEINNNLTRSPNTSNLKKDQNLVSQEKNPEQKQNDQFSITEQNAKIVKEI